MSQRSAGGFFSIRPAVFPETQQIKAGVTSLQTSASHLVGFAPSPLLRVTSSGFTAVPSRRDLHFTETFPPSSASCVRVRKCLSREAIGLCIIYLWAGRSWQCLAAPSPLRRSEAPGSFARPCVCREIPYSERVCADCLGVCCLRPTVQVNW